MCKAVYGEAVCVGAVFGGGVVGCMWGSCVGSCVEGAEWGSCVGGSVWDKGCIGELCGGKCMGEGLHRGAVWGGTVVHGDLCAGSCVAGCGRLLPSFLGDLCGKGGAGRSYERSCVGGSCVSFMSCASHPVKNCFTTPTLCLLEMPERLCVLETIYPHL